MVTLGVPSKVTVDQLMPIYAVGAERKALLRQAQPRSAESPAEHPRLVNNKLLLPVPPKPPITENQCRYEFPKHMTMTPSSHT